MSTSSESIWAVGAIMALTAFISISSWAQTFPSKWSFGNSYAEKMNKTWEERGFIVATVTGEGIMMAEDKSGNPVSGCKVIKGRPAILSAKAGDCFTFLVPVETVEAGSFIGFDATFTADPGAPKRWVVEWKDGDQWIRGREYICNGPALGSGHSYTTVHQVFKLKNKIDYCSVRVRLRALEGEVIPPMEGVESTGMAMMVTSTYIGAYVDNLGTAAPKDTTKVLCVGNSFTYYHSCPQMLKQLAWNEGHYLDMSASLKGGRTMKQHQTLGTTTDLLAEGGFDVVFLQDQSQAAGKVGDEKKKNAGLIEDLKVLADMVRETSPESRLVYECTWAYPGKEHGGFGSIANFDRYAEKGARIMAKAADIDDVSPIGKAFKYVREEHPDIMLYHTDGHHQSPYGSYLKSCVNYLLLFGKPFGDSPADCGLDPKKTAVLRKVAEKIILD